MFTLTQIHDAHAKVKSGADFPAYIRDLINLGIISYTVFVSDGHAEYHGEAGYTIRSDSKYDMVIVRASSNKPEFMRNLKAHQQGRTDYLTFCYNAARNGIEKRVVNTNNATCTYYDHNGIRVLTETIPSL